METCLFSGIRAIKLGILRNHTIDKIHSRIERNLAHVDSVFHVFNDHKYIANLHKLFGQKMCGIFTQSIASKCNYERAFVL